MRNGKKSSIFFVPPSLIACNLFYFYLSFNNDLKKSRRKKDVLREKKSANFPPTFLTLRPLHIKSWCDLSSNDIESESHTIHLRTLNEKDFMSISSLSLSTWYKHFRAISKTSIFLPSLFIEWFLASLNFLPHGEWQKTVFMLCMGIFLFMFISRNDIQRRIGTMTTQKAKRKMKNQYRL